MTKALAAELLHLSAATSGCSSIGGGAFTELGPFYPRPDGEGLRRNPSSWNKGTVPRILFFSPLLILS
ncbi:hypothetical protein Taro_054276 [Colocasia esculenta]|uniref:Uncharacterized protein n=1 Tax=Colocasia esculenta TaxID=4460 RepID=A0A843XN32_COLES|nr:hypothetical protein [Colocasia esculenta]